MPNLELNFNENDYSIVGSVETGNFNVDSGDYIRVSIFNENNNLVTTNNNVDAIFYSSIIGDFEIYSDPINNFYIKPNEILANAGIPTGNYKLQIDFLNAYNPPDDDTFLIKQISATRLEVRLKLKGNPSAINSEPNNAVISGVTSHLNSPESYQFNHILSIGKGRNIPIVNYVFDKFTDGEDSQSIILKLYDPLPNDIKKLKTVTVEREVLITQTQDVYYISETVGGVGGSGLQIDNSET